MKRYEHFQYVVRYVKLFKDFPKIIAIDSVKGYSQIEENHKQHLILLTDLLCKADHDNSTPTRAETTLFLMWM